MHQKKPYGARPSKNKTNRSVPTSERPPLDFHPRSGLRDVSNIQSLELKTTGEKNWLHTSNEKRRVQQVQSSGRDVHSLPLLQLVEHLLAVQVRGCWASSPSLLREVAAPDSLQRERHARTKPSVTTDEHAWAVRANDCCATMYCGI